MKPASLTLQFLLELAALAAYGYWGYSQGSSSVVHVALAIAVPLAAAIVWGLFGSPKGPYHLRGVWRLLLEVVFFGLAAVALIVAGHVVLGVAFAAIVAANIALLHALGEGDVASGTFLN
jgi:hypothetical protein